MLGLMYEARALAESSSSHRIGFVTSAETNDQRTELAAASGAGWIRADLIWPAIEPVKGVFNWGPIDALVAHAQAAGVKIYANPVYTPAWASSSGLELAPPTNASDWYDFISAAATRYDGKIQAFGMWNEPNVPMFWGGTRQEYIDKILKVGADAVHAASPNALVVGPVVTQYDEVNWSAWIDDVFSQAGDEIDVFGHHAYTLDQTDAGVTAKLQQIKPYVEKYGKPFWLSETGWRISDAGSAQQIGTNYAGLLDTWINQSEENNWVDKVFFYAMTTDVGSDWNVLDEYYRPRPAYRAVEAHVAATDAVGQKVFGDDFSQWSAGGDGFGAWLETSNAESLVWNLTTNAGSADRTSTYTFSSADEITNIEFDWRFANDNFDDRLKFRLFDGEGNLLLDMSALDATPGGGNKVLYHASLALDGVHQLVFVYEQLAGDPIFGNASLFYINSDNWDAFVDNIVLSTRPVPEPANAAMLMSGLLLAVRRRTTSA